MNLQQGMHGAGREGGGAGLNNQQGIALLTVMLMLLPSSGFTSAV